MSDALQTIQIMLSDAAAWRGRMEERMDETIATLHTVAASVERYSLQSTNSLEKVEARLAALEDARPGGKKAVAVAAGVGGAGGILGTLVSSGVIDFVVAVGKRILP